MRTCGSRYEKDQLEVDAESIREVLGQLEDLRDMATDTIALAEGKLTTYLEETEAALGPPWDEEPVSPQLELPLQEKVI